MDKYTKGVRNTFVRAGLIRNPVSSWLTGFAIGAGLGLIAGAAVAMLTAPTSGREMRNELGGRAKRLAERTQGAFADAAQGLKSKVRHAEADLNRGRNDIPG